MCFAASVDQVQGSPGDGETETSNLTKERNVSYRINEVVETLVLVCLPLLRALNLTQIIVAEASD